MSEHIHWMLELALKEGAADDLKALMREMVDATKADEPGALIYEWFIDEAETSVHIYERYADSAATMVHLNNFGTKFAARFMELVKPTRMTVYGAPDETVSAALKRLNATFMSEIGGFAR
ncbi:quinol monooxygenase YgiN [Breoghania corrubedonensis]|uniref:Quinol monooxygenase YgiN n=1 Tax=Breoghania corrubedonensis TaxID=665038 RepID=A0A2T5VEV7_9HYPH|nr:antibiotic biosynthesis monooxygenase [Breoghania corrubedonensis]PTW62283.1 quinol monooxygenase YgiN [Breoghania corrubedonensis]